MRILIIAAHPDDEVLGCGGTIARLANEGKEVYILILGEGITSRYDSREDADNELLKNLQIMSRRVAELLGAKDLFMYDLADNRFDTVPLLELIKIIEKLVYKLEPEVIYTHHGGDLNIDHVITHRAVMTASRPVEGCPVKEIYAFEVPSSTEWALGQFQTAFNPNVFIDITATLETKIQAMALYESETQSFPHPRSPEALRALARCRGSCAGYGAAEAFALIRAMR